VVAEFRPNKDGTCCGPYYYHYRWLKGSREKTYLTRGDGERRQRELAEKREAWRALRQLVGSPGRGDGRAEAARRNGAEGGRPENPTGRYWHGSALRDRRDFPTEERDRVLFNYNEDAIRADLGFAISEDEYVELLREVRSELARRSQRGEAREDGMVLEVGLASYPSWTPLQGVEGDPEGGTGRR